MGDSEDPLDTDEIKTVIAEAIAYSLSIFIFFSVFVTVIYFIAEALRP